MKISLNEKSSNKNRKGFAVNSWAKLTKTTSISQMHLCILKKFKVNLSAYILV